MTLELPDGFDDASRNVQRELLEGKRSEELATEIADMLGMQSPKSSVLNKDHKAELLIRLRESATSE